MTEKGATCSTATPMRSGYISGLGCVVSKAIGCSSFDQFLREPTVVPTKVDLDLGHSGWIFALPDPFDFEAQINALELEPALDARILKLGRRGSVTVQASLLAAAEAWKSAQLEAGQNIGLILAGNNFDPLSGYVAAREFSEEDFVAPSRAMNWLDGHILGAISEAFCLTGPGLQVGGSSAAGLVGVCQAHMNIQAGLAERWMVIAPPMILSPVEWSAFANVGALAGFDIKHQDAKNLCAPFDEARKGFVPGIGSAALVLERDHGQAGIIVSGSGLCMDAHSRMEPNAQGESSVMVKALCDAQLAPSDVSYVNTHGSGSIVGDRCEADALQQVFGRGGPAINATKGLVGHCLTSAGLIEVVATCLQMMGGYLHGNPNLLRPLSPYMNFVGRHTVLAETSHALCNSYAFAGVNASVALSYRRLQAI